MTDEETKTTTKQAAPKPKPVKRQSVKLIAHQGESALVEWLDEGWHRVYIPLTEYDFERQTVAVDVLAAGLPYGVDWSRLDLAIDMVALDYELKKHGIWTRTDLDQNPQKANAAINRTLGVMRRQLLAVAEKGGNK